MVKPYGTKGSDAKGRARVEKSRLEVVVGPGRPRVFGEQRRSPAFARVALWSALRAATPARMKPLSRRSTLGVVLVALVACLAARGVCARDTTSVTRTKDGHETFEFAERASAGDRQRARATRPRSPRGRQGPRTNPIALQRAPRAIVSGALRLCGGAPVPAQLFVGRPNEVVCLEQRLAGVTPRQVRRRSLDVTGVNVTFDGVPIHPASVGAPELFSLARTPEDSSTGSTSAMTNETKPTPPPPTTTRRWSRGEPHPRGTRGRPGRHGGNPRVHGVRPPGGKILLRDRVV